MNALLVLIVLTLEAVVAFIIIFRYQRRQGRVPRGVWIVGIVLALVVNGGLLLLWDETRSTHQIEQISRPLPKPTAERPYPPPPLVEPATGRRAERPPEFSKTTPGTEMPDSGYPDYIAYNDITYVSVDVVDEVYGALDWGNLAFNAPTAMKYGQTTVVELLLSPTLSTSDLQGQLHDQTGAETAEARISNRMEATLTGHGFAVEALTPEVQAVSSRQVTRWAWEVTAQSSGSRTLHVALSSLVDVAGTESPIVVRTFDRDIVVRVTVRQRVAVLVSTNWQWLWAAILVPVAGYVWKVVRKRRPGRR